jgi:hypothetical protein
MTFLSQDLVWWITVIDLPAMAGLFGLIWRTRHDGAAARAHLRSLLDKRHNQMRDALSGFKLEVAKHYASQTDMRDLEMRLVDHLLRIESKLDATAMKTAALGHHSPPAG